MEAQANSITVDVDLKKEYKLVLRAEQLKLLLSVIGSAHFPGERAFVVADTISALQKPLLDDAHGASAPED